MKAQRPRSEVPKAERRPDQLKTANPPAQALRREQPKAAPKSVPKAANPPAPAPRPEQPKAVPKAVPKAERKRTDFSPAHRFEGIAYWPQFLVSRSIRTSGRGPQNMLTPIPCHALRLIFLS
jgi:hypothetical protein